MTKAELRKHMKAERNNLDISLKKQYDAKIYDTLIQSEEYRKADVIFIYVSYNSEADTHHIIHKAIEDRKIVCVPKVISKEKGMIAVQIKNFEDLKPGAYGILEPEGGCRINEENIDLVILPGLAFDLNGGRLGYGAGFYDRFLLNLRAGAMLIGIAYRFQMVDEVPMNCHDRRIHKVVTD